ncbi:MAG: ThiF family adenylyltransferase [Planctomycetia bacterium]|nr:ThiF family adenylyltransferase [Planctomycetia bacterium]
MAASTQLNHASGTSPIVRIANPELDLLTRLVFSRYPRWEWATFARFGWRERGDGLVISLAALEPPTTGDLDSRVGHVAIQEPYTLRVALAAEKHPLAVGVIHSHPREGVPEPSSIDDDMDGYYAQYLQGFAPSRPYVSLILSQIHGQLVMSGRVFWRGAWHVVKRFSAEPGPVQSWVQGVGPTRMQPPRASTRRLSAAFGDEADSRLRQSTVAVIGAGGTGSAAIEVLARAGVGKLIIVDPDCLEESNLERVHGSIPRHASERRPKVAIAYAHAKAVNPACEIQAFVGSLPQAEIVDAVVGADAMLGCTDRQHSRLAISDLAVRYLVPSIDCGVMLEGQGGSVTGQIAQIVRFLPADACALCRGMVQSVKLHQELMSEEERERRREAARAAAIRGENAAAYWSDEPQLNTVGYLTTAVGALTAGYVLGWLTGRFATPFERLQMNLVAPFLDVTDNHVTPRADCTCRRVRGWADQAQADALISAPGHWPSVQLVHSAGE